MTEPPPFTGARAWARLAARLVLLAGWTFALVSARLLSWLVVVLSTRAERNSRRFLFRLWGRGASRLLGFRVDIQGTPPKAPFLLVCNHQTYADAFVMTAGLGCVYVAMVEVAGWPLIGRLGRVVRVIFIDRSKIRDATRVNRLIAGALADGEGVTVFPEGGTSDGASVRPFKPALLQPAAESGWPVHYATIRYRTPPGHPPPSSAVCWVDETPFMAHALRLLRLPRVYATLIFGEEPIAHPDRKVLAERLRQAVEAQLLSDKPREAL